MKYCLYIVFTLGNVFFTLEGYARHEEKPVKVVLDKDSMENYFIAKHKVIRKAKLRGCYKNHFGWEADFKHDSATNVWSVYSVKRKRFPAIVNKHADWIEVEKFVRIDGTTFNVIERKRQRIYKYYEK